MTYDYRCKARFLVSRLPQPARRLFGIWRYAQNCPELPKIKPRAQKLEGNDVLLKLCALGTWIYRVYRVYRSNLGVMDVCGWSPLLINRVMFGTKMTVGLWTCANQKRLDWFYWGLNTHNTKIIIICHQWSGNIRILPEYYQNSILKGLITIFFFSCNWSIPGTEGSPCKNRAPRGDTLLIRGCGRTDFQQERAGRKTECGLEQK